jgi:hypothetical protein
VKLREHLKIWKKLEKIELEVKNKAW